MLYLEIQRGKSEVPKWSEQYCELGATTSCSMRATTKMANCGQKIEEHRQNLNLANSWFSSVKTAEAIHESGHEWIGVVKTSHSLFPKKALEDKLKTWLDGMNLTLEATTSKGVRLIAVGYKYNSSKVLCFVATKNVGSTIAGDPYRACFSGLP
jgi:predicted GTPase